MFLNHANGRELKKKHLYKSLSWVIVSACIYSTVLLKLLPTPTNPCSVAETSDTCLQVVRFPSL